MDAERDRGWPPGRPWRRYRAWLTRSITNRVTIRTIGLTMAVALVLGVTSYVAVRHLVTSRIDANLQHHATLVEHELSSRLTAIAQDVESLAANSFIANGLVDSSGRDTYLVPFLREHRVPGATAVDLVLCDFQGLPVASNLSVSPPCTPASTRALATGRPAAELVQQGSRSRLLVAVPVTFPPTGHQEGVLMALVDLAPVFAGAVRGRDPDIEATLQATGKRLLTSAANTAGPMEREASRALSLAPPLDALALRVVLAQAGAVLAPVRRLGLLYVLIGLATLLATSAAARREARGLTARIARLSEAARGIAAGGGEVLPAGAEPHDEVDTVAVAFNGTLAKLRAVQDSLEHQVSVRTADLQLRENELRHSQEQLAHAIEGSQLGVWVWDHSTGEMSFNDLWPSLLGYSPAEIGLAIEDWVRLVHPDDVERTGQGLVDHLKGLTPRLDAQYRIRAKDGSWRWLHTRGRVMERDGAGRAIRLAGTNADVSWRVATEEKLKAAAAANERLLADLKASEERLRLSLASGTHAEWDWDIVHDSFTQGGRWWELLGVPPGAVANTIEGWRGVLHPEDRDRAWTALFACVDGGGDEYNGHYRIRTGAGTWRWIRSRGRVIARDARGRAVRMTGTRTDVTELEELQEKLLAATRLASVGTLAAGVAHEINNPLSYLLGSLSAGMAELANPATLEERRSELRQLLEEARHGAERIASIVKSMRALGGPERQGDARTIDVRAELLDAIQLVRNQLSQRARLEVSVEPMLPLTRASTSELGRAFLGLLVNAVQAIPEGQAAGNLISVSARSIGATIVVEVADSGSGIPPEARDRIFEAFFTTRPVGVGTGLGLTVARSIVESAGGTLEFESEVGRGSTFRVRLPASPHAEASPALPSGPAVGGGARSRVFVIDDEPLVRRSLERLLAPHHDVVAFGAAGEALDRIAAGERCDAILCDLMMTGLDGVGFYEAVAVHHPALLGRLAFVTGGVFGERATRFLTAHDVVVVTKPVDVQELLRVVGELVRPRLPGG